MKHALPKQLSALIEAGAWPTETGRQDLQPLLGKAAANQLSLDDDRIILMPPPFHTIGDEVRKGNDFWTSDITNVGEIDYDSALIIADFGPGSDSPIVLYYKTDTQPSVMYLRWIGDGDAIRHQWIETHATFAAFASAIGLDEGLAGVVTK